MLREPAHAQAAALAWMRYLERSKSFLVDLMQGQLILALLVALMGSAFVAM